MIMNRLDRIILATGYDIYIQNAMNGDPVGGFQDLRAMFVKLAETDEELNSIFRQLEEEAENKSQKKIRKDHEH